MTASKLRAAVYARVSTEEQAAEGTTSLDDQVRKCRAHAEHKGWTVVAEFREEGFTGTSENRPQWDRLMVAASGGEFDVVVCLTTNRFARDTLTGLLLQRELSGLGVDLETTDTSIDRRSDNGELMNTMLLAFSTHQRKALLRTMAAGAHAAARDGRWPAGSLSAPFGLSTEGTKRDTRLVLHEREAETIRLAARLLVDEGVSVPDVARELNAREMLPRSKARKGGVKIPTLWTPQLVRRHLDRDSLAGQVLWGAGRNATGKYGEGVLIEAPQVLSPQRLEAVRLALRATEKRSGDRLVYPLSLRMQSVCGKQYTGIFRGDRDLRSYRCQGKQQPPACGCPWLDAEPIEDRVWQAVCELLGDPERLARLAREYLALESGRALTQQQELDLLREQIAQREQQLAAGVTAYLRAGVDPGAMAAATRTMQEELDAMRRREATIRLHQEQSAGQAQVIDQAARLAGAAAGRLHALSVAERAEVIRLLDVRVELADASRTPGLTIRGTICDLDDSQPCRAARSRRSARR